MSTQIELLDKLTQLRKDYPTMEVKLLVDTEFSSEDYRYSLQLIKSVDIVPWFIVDGEKILTSDDDIEQWHLEQDEEGETPHPDIYRVIAEKIASVDRVIAITTMP